MLLLNARLALGRRRERRRFPVGGGMLVFWFVENDGIIGAQQRPSLMHLYRSRIGAFGKVRVATKDGAALFQEANGIVAEPAPQSRTGDLGGQTLTQLVRTRLRDRERGPGNSGPVKKFVGPCLKRNDETGKKS